jgi:predicted unusual protein kinase regulating ubiquinone biosynthesis (AarF/ABC1/UbiB family)
MHCRRSWWEHAWRFARLSQVLFATFCLLTWQRSRLQRWRADSAAAHLSHTSENYVVLRAMRRFCATAGERGGLLIKLGQFLSVRADLLPRDALTELAQLQDQVPAAPFLAVRAVLEQDLGVSLQQAFARIDPVPAGSASFGQVHHALLHDGREVAVKVQRPGIEEIIRTDLCALRFVITIIRWAVPAARTLTDLDALYHEFRRMVYEELDYEREARHAERFARIVAQEPNIRVPKVVWEHTRQRVLTLEWVGGQKICNPERLSLLGADGAALARRLLDLYVKHLLVVGFFHADPHPGNILVAPTRDGFNLVFVDFGMMGSIPPRMRQAFRDVLFGMMQRDTNLVVRGLRTLGVLTSGANHDAARLVLLQALDRISQLPLRRLGDVDAAEMVDIIDAVLCSQGFQLPAQFAFLGRAVAMLLGLTTLLAPDLDVHEMLSRSVRQLVGASMPDGALRIPNIEGFGGLSAALILEGLRTARSLAALPQLAEHILRRAERGEFRLTLELSDPRPSTIVPDGGFGGAVGQMRHGWTRITAGATIVATAIATILVVRHRNSS